MANSAIRRIPIGRVAGAIVILAVLGLFLPAHWTQLLTRVLIMALFATSLNIQVGYAGMLPLGHSMFLGLGAYSFCLLLVKTGMPMLLAFPLALVISTAMCVIIGYLCLKSNDAMTFGLLHLAFNILLSTLINKWITFTGGEVGITGISRPSFLADTTSFYFFVLAWFVVCYGVIWTIVNSPFSKAAHGLRENEERLRFLGINIARFQLVIFTLSGFFAAIAGVLLSMLDKAAFPAYITLTKSAEALMMCLIGGMFSFFGPSIGAAIVVVFGTVTSIYISQWQGLLGIIILACVIGFRGGILGKGRRMGVSGGGS
jgi:branched-chain amino acid transport system permease protein